MWILKREFFFRKLLYDPPCQDIRQVGGWVWGLVGGSAKIPTGPIGTPPLPVSLSNTLPHTSSSLEVPNTPPSGIQLLYAPPPPAREGGGGLYVRNKRPKHQPATVGRATDASLTAHQLSLCFGRGV